MFAIPALPSEFLERHGSKYLPMNRNIYDFHSILQTSPPCAHWLYILVLVTFSCLAGPSAFQRLANAIIPQPRNLMRLGKIYLKSALPVLVGNVPQRFLLRRFKKVPPSKTVFGQVTSLSVKVRTHLYLQLSTENPPLVCKRQDTSKGYRYPPPDCWTSWPKRNPTWVKSRRNLWGIWTF